MRTGDTTMPELTPEILQECLDHFYFVGVDPSGLQMMSKMKKQWESAGRPSTHYYQGFREVRWASIKKAVEFYIQNGERGDRTSAEVVKDVMEKLVMRDGFKIGGSMNYVIENWENCRHATEELVIEGRRFLLDTDEDDKARLLNPNAKCFDAWQSNKRYSPDQAEAYREEAREQLYARVGVK
jgi:hypothetical protein